MSPCVLLVPTHSNKVCIVGTWVVDEVHKDAEMGHGLEVKFQFWEYEVT